jgi:hypothetical protein
MLMKRQQKVKNTRFKTVKICGERQVSGTVGGLESETCKHCTGNCPSKDTALPTVFSDRVASWAACAIWKASYPF